MLNAVFNTGFKDVPPELADVVRRFEDRMGDVRTQLIRARADLHAEQARRAEPPPPEDHFDFDYPISSCAREAW